jgi:hypothetical protein
MDNKMFYDILLIQTDGAVKTLMTVHFTISELEAFLTLCGKQGACNIECSDNEVIAVQA